MRIRSTEDLIQFANKTLTAAYPRQNLISQLYAVHIRWDNKGEVKGNITHLTEGSNQWHYFNKNGVLIESRTTWYSWRNTNSYTKAKDNKDGMCCLLYKNYEFFTTKEEAQHYIDTYTENHPEEYIKALKEAAKKHRSAINQWKRYLKDDTKELEEITNKLKTLEG